MSIYFLIGRIYFNQPEQCSTAVNSDGELLSKHFWINDKIDSLVTIYANCSGPLIKIATMPRYTGIKNPLKSSTEPKGQLPSDLVCSIRDEGYTKFAQIIILG